MSHDSADFSLAPGAHIGILGGGQLGRMLAVAAARFGYRVTVYCPEADCPAAQVAGQHIIAPYSDQEALAAFAGATDLVTYEFENIPLAALETVAALKPLAPSIASLRTAQDRLTEKDFLSGEGIAVTPYSAFSDAASLAQAYETVGRPAIAKTRRSGYDGKGQMTVHSRRDFAAALEAMASQPAILEKRVDFEMEISAVAARNRAGDIALYPLGHNVHEDGILRTTEVPALLADGLEARARIIAGHIAEALGHVGVLAVEMFVTVDGHLLVNEIAPRVHNSGHWTLEGTKCSQFEQHIRAICGLPLGPTEALGRLRTDNLLGSDILDHKRWLADPQAHFHHYGKQDPRAGRKMGHVTRLLPRKED